MTDTFFKNSKYLELKKKLGFNDAQLLIDIIGEAIQYGIDLLKKEVEL